MINTHSKFWYGWEITEENQLLDFRYASDLNDRQAVLRIGRYSSRQLCDEIKRAMDEAGTDTFVVTFDRASKKFTISCEETFSLLTSSGEGVALGSVWELIGFSTASDKTGSASYTADSTSVPFEWTPQFKLQGINNPDDWVRLRDPVWSESAAGEGELTHFGEMRMLKFSVPYITDIIQPDELVIRNNATAVADARRAMSWATKKAHVELMLDENDEETYLEIRLEATEDSQIGVELNLKEEYQKGLPNYFTTGELTWRVIE